MIDLEKVEALIPRATEYALFTARTLREKEAVRNIQPTMEGRGESPDKVLYELIVSTAPGYDYGQWISA